MRAHVRQSNHPHALGRGPRRRRRPALRIACLIAAVGWACLSPPESQARVNPLVIIQRQLHKANMLIVLDTSGSMTGVPGGVFANRTEAGVDCDNGTNCRMGGVLGICTQWGRVCQSNDDCRIGYCHDDGITQCNSTLECPQPPGLCSVPTRSCGETTRTQTGTITRTGSGTATTTTTLTGSNTETTTTTQTGTTTQTTTKTQTITTTETARVTARVTVTITGTFTSTNTANYSDWPPDWHDTHTYTTTNYLRGTGTATTTSLVTATYDGTATKTFNLTGTMTGTASSTGTATVFMDEGRWSTTVSKTGWQTWQTEPATVTESGTATRTRSVSWTYWGTRTDTDTGTGTGTKTGTGTITTTGTRTTTGTPTGTTTMTTSSSGTETGTQTITDISCTVTNAECSTEHPCPELTGSVCSATGVACDASNPCQTLGSCKYTHILCSNPGGNCPDVSVCAQATSTTCSSPADCPPTSSTGTCSLGGTPQGGCTDNNDCPSYKNCSSTYDSCRIDGDCPLPSTGVCSTSGARCNNTYMRCPNPQTCIFSPQTCEGTDNVCNREQDTCIPKTDNTCTGVANTCDTPVNTCVYPAQNVCIPPVSSTDTCAPSADGTPGPIRMCRITQTVCKKDADCTTAGDQCGPATSRTVIAKRAVTSVVNNNHKVLNFGLMTYYQGGYFPYYLNTSGSSEIVSVFEAVDKLASLHCYSRRTGPAHTCRINSIDMTLRGSPNSRYRVRTDWRTWVDVDADWCGRSCDLPGAVGLGTFQGAYYEYTATTGPSSTTLLTHPTYDGPNITVSGQNYSYYKPLNNYYNGGKAPPLDFADCGSTCSAQCGGRWDTQLAPFLSTADDPVISETAAAAITRAMSPAANGGLITYWGTPTGCTLQNNVARSVNTNAYDYMDAVIRAGDASRGSPVARTTSCSSPTARPTARAIPTALIRPVPQANPVSAGCQCRSVLAAYNLRQDLGVKTFVVGFAGDVVAGAARTTNDNIARAGGTDNDGDGVAPFAYLAQNEDELNNALQLVIYEAVRGSYSTAPTSTSAGTQQATTVAEGRYALDSRMDFPEWRGHLLAYDLAGDHAGAGLGRLPEARRHQLVGAPGLHLGRHEHGQDRRRSRHESRDQQERAGGPGDGRQRGRSRVGDALAAGRPDPWEPRRLGCHRQFDAHRRRQPGGPARARRAQLLPDTPEPAAPHLRRRL